MVTPTPLSDGPEWINQRLAEMQRQINELRSAVTLESAIIEDGDLVVDGGAIKSRDYNGTTLFYLGNIEPNLDDGRPQRGMIMRRNDGSVVLGLFDAFPGDGAPANYRQALNWYDRNGNVVVADDTDGGIGLARPYVPYTLTSGADNQNVTAATFTETHTIAGPRQHPKMTVGISVFTSDGTTAGEVRIVAGATVLAGPTVIPAGGSIAPAYVFTLPAASHMGLEYLAIQARRTAGAGNIIVRPFFAYGIQT
jgi:hypothetical protein